MTDGEKRYQILRGRLYERLPVLALALGLDALLLRPFSVIHSAISYREFPFHRINQSIVF